MHVSGERSATFGTADRIKWCRPASHRSTHTNCYTRALDLDICAYTPTRRDTGRCRLDNENEILISFGECGLFRSPAFLAPSLSRRERPLQTNDYDELQSLGGGSNSVNGGVARLRGSRDPRARRPCFLSSQRRRAERTCINELNASVPSACGSVHAAVASAGISSRAASLCVVGGIPTSDVPLGVDLRESLTRR